MMYLTHFARITHVSFPEVGPWFCNWYFVVNNWYLACEFSILQRVSKFLGSVFSTLGGGGGGGGLAIGHLGGFPTFSFAARETKKIVFKSSHQQNSCKAH